MILKKPYNERLFRSGFRKWLHEARFLWASRVFEKYNPDISCVAELGCFDGRALQYIPTPKLYFGFDADWEGGLAAAQKNYYGYSDYFFKKCVTPDQFECNNENVTCSICLETLEHIPASLLDGYINKIDSSMTDGGFFIVSVPNEKGVVFFFKHLIKVIFLF